MTLADLRRVTVKKNLRIRFSLSNGMECVVNEHGVAQVPALRAVPAFNLEDDLSRAQEFLIETTAVEKDKPKPRRCTRDELAAMTAATGAAGPAHDDHDE